MKRTEASPIGPWFPQPQSILPTALRWCLLLLGSAYFGLSYASLPTFLNLAAYTRGAADLPYQYRVLPMFIFRWLTSIPAVMQLGRHTAALGNDPYRVILAGLAMLSLIGAVLATAETIRLLTGDKIYAFCSSLLIIWMAQLDLGYAWDNPFTTPYDVPSVMLFALAMMLILHRRWWLYYLVFVLAVLNRESACFITVFFAAWEWIRLRDAGKNTSERLRWVAPQVALQAALWIAIKIALAYSFAHNRGPGQSGANKVFITHVALNLRELVNFGQWPLLASVAGFSLPFLWLQRRWISSPGLAWALATVLPLSFAGLMIVGVITEIRIFADWIALTVPAIALIVHNRFRPVSPGES